jgi:hypothetical protein
MNSTVIPSSLRLSADRIGVTASVLCAIHCALTPILLILAPTFGGMWSHPLSHWIAAAFVIPLAVWMVIRGFRRHHKYWILAAGITGVSLILAGAALPHFSPTESAETAEGSACQLDACCPSVVVDSAGESRLHIPPAATVTTLGGFLLITTHLGNLCACRNCKICNPKKSKKI